MAELIFLCFYQMPLSSGNSTQDRMFGQSHSTMRFSSYNYLRNQIRAGTFFKVLCIDIFKQSKKTETGTFCKVVSLNRHFLIMKQNTNSYSFEVICIDIFFIMKQNPNRYVFQSFMYQHCQTIKEKRNRYFFVRIESIVLCSTYSTLKPLNVITDNGFIRLIRYGIKLPN